MDKTPNEYIRWRYAGGEDREAIAKDTMKISDAELELQKTVIDFVYTDPDTAKTTKTKRVIKRLTGERKTNKSTKENDYEVQFKAPHDGDDCKHFYGYKKLVKWGWDKACKKVDVKVAQAASGMFRPLTSSNVESHLKNVGLDAEFATHHRISALSGGQKVKVVLGAAMWMQPHLVILDEPTNYLDRESLGALADAIREFEGGMIPASRCVETPSRHRGDSSPPDELVGGLWSKFEPFRTASRDHDAPRRRRHHQPQQRLHDGALPRDVGRREGRG
jgi:elongation factor 3